MTKKILKWTDKEMKKVMYDEDVKCRTLKAFGLGVIEGAIDGAVIAYPILIACCYLGKKADKK